MRPFGVNGVLIHFVPFMMRKILGYTVLILVLLFMGLATWVYFNQDTLKKQAVQQLNSQLQAPVNIAGISLTLQQWPHMAVAFNEVYAPGRYASAPRDTFMYFQSVQITFDWWQALSKKFVVKSIYGLNGTVNLHDNGKQSNYLLFKPGKDSATVHASLQGIYLLNTQFTLRHNNKKIIKTYLEKLQFEGDFFNELNLENYGKFRGFTIYRKGKAHALKKQVTVKSRLENKAMHFAIKDGSLNMGEQVEATFLVEILKNVTSVQFDLQKQNLPHVVELLKDASLSIPQSLLDDAKGAVHLKGRYYNQGNQQNLQAQLQIPDLRWPNNSPTVFQSGQVKARLNIGMKGDVLEVDSLSLKSASGSLQGHGSIVNFNARPEVKMQLSSTLSLADWLTFSSAKVAGNSNARLKAKVRLQQQFTSLKNIKLENIDQRNLRGFLQVDEGNINMGNSLGALQNINGRLNFEPQHLTIERLYAKKGTSDFYLTGRLQNFLPFLFKPHQSLKADGKFISQNINLADFLTQQTQTSETDFLRYFAQLNLQLQLQIDALQFQNFKARKIGGLLRARDGNISLNDAKMALADGQLNGSMYLNTHNDSITLKSNFKAQNMALSKLFAAFDNFGQTTLYSKHLKGNATVQSELSLRLTPNFQVDLSSIKAKSTYRITNGRLTQFEPMLALSRFAQMNQLRDVRFAELKSSLQINNEQIRFAPTAIQSNVLDFIGTGTHNFNNQIDYRVRLRVQEVLSKKEEKSDLPPELAQHVYEQESEDVPFLYLRLTGNALHPSVSIDKEAWLSSVGKDLQKQKKEWRQKLEKKENSKPENNGIQFEWDGF